jgi:hypothetical protein
MTYFPAEELTVVVMSNSYSPIAGAIAKDVSAIAVGQSYAIPIAPSVGSRPIDSRLLGSWSLEGFPNPLSIEMRRGRAIGSWNTVRQTAILRTGEDSYFLPLDWATVVFRFDGDRAIEGTWTAPWADKPLKLTHRTDAAK